MNGKEPIVMVATAKFGIAAKFVDKGSKELNRTGWRMLVDFPLALSTNFDGLKSFAGAEFRV
jgi:hypothetical protein